MDADYGDNPISKPEQDMFGIDGFVQSLARSVRTMRSPNGVVIALNGPWGSGKSSAINLLKHHLANASAAGEIEVVDFNPWWFRGEEALVLAFFRELYSATKPSLGNKAKKILPKLGARLLNASGAVAPIADAAGAAGAGAISTGSWKCCSRSSSRRPRCRRRSGAGRVASSRSSSTDRTHGATGSMIRSAAISRTMTPGSHATRLCDHRSITRSRRWAERLPTSCEAVARASSCSPTSRPPSIRRSRR